MGLNYPDFLRMLQAELEELDYLGGGEGRDCRKQGPGTNGTFSLSSQVEAALGVIITRLYISLLNELI